MKLIRVLLALRSHCSQWLSKWERGSLQMLSGTRDGGCSRQHSSFHHTVQQRSVSITVIYLVTQESEYTKKQSWQLVNSCFNWAGIPRQFYNIKGNKWKVTGHYQAPTFKFAPVKCLENVWVWCLQHWMTGCIQYAKKSKPYEIWMKTPNIRSANHFTWN